MAIDDSYTKVLLHMDGADASTTFTDESGKTWTARGNAQIDTAQSEFGGASGLFDGTGDYVDTPDNSDFELGTGDWTIDCWVRRNGAQAYGGLFTMMDAAYDGMILDLGAAGTTLRMVSDYTGAPATNITASGVLTDLAWVHVALVRYGNTITLYQGGTSVGSVACMGWNCNSSGDGFGVGQNIRSETTLYTWKGWIDEFRFSKGIARWTANFTPPTAPYAPPTFIPRIVMI